MASSSLTHIHVSSVLGSDSMVVAGITIRTVNHLLIVAGVVVGRNPRVFFYACPIVPVNLIRTSMERRGHRCSSAVAVVTITENLIS